MKATQPTLEERIRILHQELDSVIAKYVDSRAAVCPGVPRASVEASVLSRAGGCACAEYRLVHKLITDAEELVRKQQVDATL